MRLEKKVALVTGSAKRVGRTIAEALAANGCSVAIHYNSSEKEAQETAKHLREKFEVKAECFQAELGNVRRVTAMVDDIVVAFGRIDILVNSASYYERVEFGKTTEEDWEKAMDSNLKGPFFLSQEAGRHMKRQGAGKIINISDWAALHPYTTYIPYCTAKAGLYYLTHSLAKALAPEVQVNTILPGPIQLPEDVGPKERRAIEEATLVKRIGSPKDVAEAIIFLLEQDFITGAALNVDGGRMVNSTNV